MRRALRLAALIAAGLVILLVAVIAAVQVRPVQNSLAGWLSGLVSSPDFTIEIAGLDGSLPFGPRLSRLILGDAQGPWAVVEDAALDLDGAALLTGRIHVEKLTAARLHLLRLPGPATQPAPPPSGGPLVTIPSLPKGLAIDRLEVAAIDLDPAVAGRAARFRLDGRLGVDPQNGRAVARLSLLPADGGTRLVLDAAHDPAADDLALDLALDEEPGGPLARLAGLGDNTAIRVTIKGTGPIDGFKAAVAAEAGGARFDGTVTLARPQGGEAGGLGLSLVATATPGPLVPEAFRAAVGDAVALTLAAAITERDVTITRLEVTTALARLVATGHVVDGAASNIAAEIHLDPAHLPPAAEQVPAGLRPGLIQVEATLDAAFAVATIDRLIVTMPAATITAKGRVSDGFDRVKGELAGTLEDLALLPELGLQGRAQLAATVEGTVAARALAFTVAADGAAVTGAGALGGLLGPAPRLTAAGAIAGPAVTLASLEAVFGGGQFNASGTGDLDQASLDLALDGALPDLAVLGTDYAGAVRLTGSAKGRLTEPAVDLDLSGSKVVVAGQDLGMPSVTLHAEPRSDGRSTGTFNLVSGGAWPVTVSSQVSVAADGLALSGLAAKGLGVTMAGAVDYGFAQGTAKGRLVLAAKDLAALSGLAGGPLGGRIDGTIVLTERGGGQGLDLDLQGADLRQGALRLATLAVEARLDDLLGAGRGTARLTAGHGSAGPRTLDKLTLDVAAKSFTALTLQVAAAGTLPAAARLNATAEVAMAGVPTITVAQLDGMLGDRPLRLERPATITLGAAPAVDDLALRFGAGRLSGALALGARPKGRLVLERIALADFRPLAGPRLPSGTVDGSLAVDGGTGHLALTLTKVQPGTDQDLVIAARDLAPLGLTARVDWGGDSAQVAAAITGIADSTLDLGGTLPISTASGLPLPRDDGGIDLTLAVDADLARLSALAPVGETRMRGRVKVDARARGSLTAPVLDGRATIANGRVDNGTTGLSLRQLEMSVALDGDHLTIEKLQGTDGDGGTLALAGSLRLGAQPRIDTTLEARKFRFTGLELLTTRGDADLTLAGPLDDLRLAGALTVRQGQVGIAATLPPSVPEVAVRDPEQTPEPIAPQGSGGGLVKLDLSVDVPGQFFVRGRGLDSEWRGKITVGGTSVAPEIAGGLQVVRGTFALAGRDFRIEEGALTFPSGLKAPPQLLVVASAPADDITAKVTVAGPANAVKIALSSDPVLPSDEVLSRVLFGSSVANLTASQAIRLAQTALELSGRGGSVVLGAVRDTLGLDRLDIGSDDSAPDEASKDGKSAGALAGTSLSAGRYVADGVFLGFEQGMTPDSSAVTVEVEIYPRVTIEGSVGAPAKTGIGLNYKFDY